MSSFGKALGCRSGDVLCLAPYFVAEVLWDGRGG